MKLLAALLLTLPLLAAEKPQGTLGLGYAIHNADKGELEQWLFVRGVMPGGAAEKAGMRAQGTSSSPSTASRSRTRTTSSSSSSSPPFARAIA